MTTTTLHKWAADMLAVVHRIRPDIDGGIGGMGSEEGSLVTQQHAEFIMQEFKLAGYDVERRRASANIRSRISPYCGVTIEPTQESDDTYVLNFFDVTEQGKAVVEPPVEVKQYALAVMEDYACRLTTARAKVELLEAAQQQIHAAYQQLDAGTINREEFDAVVGRFSAL